MYPAQSRPGIETIVADEEQTTVVDRALAILHAHASKHIQSKIYTDEELRFVSEEDAPGVTSYREKLRCLVEGYSVRSCPHEEIILKLDRAGERFRVLVVKTKMRIPYTSMFLELKCGYWNTQAEKRLRAAMRSKDRYASVPKRRGRLT